MTTFAKEVCSGRLSDTASKPSVTAEPVQLPLPLRGSRKIRSRSSISARGVILARFRNSTRLAQVGYESTLERAFVLIALADCNTTDIVEQPFTLRFVDSESRPRRYTFDYLVTMRDGRRVAVEVKNSQQASKPKVISKVRDAASRLVPDYADEVVLFTEKNFTRTQVENAEQFLNCQREADPNADNRLLAVISSLQGSMSVGDLVKISGLAERGYPAVVRAMYSNLLHWKMDALIGPKMMVSREVMQ